MRNKYLEAGKIVGTHGIKGMVHIQPWADSGEFLRQFKKFYLDSNGSEFLNAERVSPAKNVVTAKFSDIDSISEAEALRGKIIYIDRNDVKLPDGRYFIDDLIGCEVYNTEHTLLGKISDISKTGANDVWHIESNGKSYLFPAVDEMLESIDIEAQRIYIKPIKGIFDDED